MKPSRDSQDRPTTGPSAPEDHRPRKAPGHQRFSVDLAKIVSGFRLLGLEREEDRSRFRKLAGQPVEAPPNPAERRQELNNTTRSTD